jgi:hypothetical protein
MRLVVRTGLTICCRATLLMLPSTVARLEDGTPVAWAFMGGLGRYCWTWRLAVFETDIRCRA